MPRRRSPAETAYERRIRLYLERNPGATRQEARGHKPPRGTSEYQQRIRRARAQTPGISRRAAAGHGTPAERHAIALMRRIGKLPPDALITFTGTDRQRDGTWKTARFDVISPDGTDQTWLIGPDGHYLLAAIADDIADSGITVLGASYLSKMAR